MKNGILTVIFTISAAAVSLTAFSQDRGAQQTGIEPVASLCVAQTTDGQCYAWLEAGK